ncbi:OLC1v1032385C1 [Oldenlandia corymbosa var. corymbosa]|uniref:OLC1v1032385C1 n=1 Tax=Oldenlandia corymbosa var. corymbosa TaxID=529605 RepID=A0AAV1CNT3_OLDCO|nr:OLC1v1032385C1 [Oldenlandia corymbosa var. corymbosa]
MRSIVKVWAQVMKGVRWDVCDGKKVNFWRDCWLPNGRPLLESAVDRIPVNQLDWKARDYVTQEGQWNWAAFGHLVEDAIRFGNEFGTLMEGDMGMGRATEGEELYVAHGQRKIVD